jgi:hypothetical protein
MSASSAYNLLTQSPERNSSNSVSFHLFIQIYLYECFQILLVVAAVGEYSSSATL